MYLALYPLSKVKPWYKRYDQSVQDVRVQSCMVTLLVLYYV